MQDARRLINSAFNPLFTGSLISELAKQNNNKKFPHYDVYKDGTMVAIVVAMAGFKKEDIKLKFSNGMLYLTATPVDITTTFSSQSTDTITVKKGITSKPVDITFSQLEGYELTSAKMSDGLLVIELVESATFEVTVDIK